MKTDNDEGEKEDHQSESNPPPNGSTLDCPNDANNEFLEESTHPAESADALHPNNVELDCSPSQSTTVCVSDAPLEDGIDSNGDAPALESQASAVDAASNTETPPLQNTIVSTSEPSHVGDQGDNRSETLGEGPARAAVRRRSSGTKSLFRSARALAPGAVSMSVTRRANSAGGSDGASQDEGSASAARSSRVVSSNERYSQEESDDGFHPSEEFSASSFVRRRESGTLPDIVGEEGEPDEFRSFLQEDIDAASHLSPQIVTAEVVESGTTMDQSERRRIVQEAIHTISNQAVAAEVVHHDRNKPFGKNPAVLLSFVVIIIGMTMVIVFISRDSDSPEYVFLPPTNTPTVFVDDSVFQTTDELYHAVDAYVLLLTNSSDEFLIKTSDVALRYGYPISSWNVSLITNFSRVFDPTRISPELIWEFNEDLGDWDVSKA